MFIARFQIILRGIKAAMPNRLRIGSGHRRRWQQITLAVLAAIGLVAGALVVSSDEWFVPWSTPIEESHRLFDVGIVDADGDGRLDIYTSNHHFRQSLLLANGQGGYRDVLSEWGLDQSPEFPKAELTFRHPSFDKAGLYIYWLGTQLIIRPYEMAEATRWRGQLRVNDPVDVMKDEGFLVEKQEQFSAVAETVLGFAPTGDGILRLRPGGQGLPISFEFDGELPPERIFVGLGKISPTSMRFALTMLDRHAMAWADYNGDDVLDLFINRGALGGSLRAYSNAVSEAVRDELLLSQSYGQYAEMGFERGIRKRGCSSRHARWVDVNSDGLLDLFVNCHDRGSVEGSYPKQLYVQDEAGRLHDEAGERGLGLADQQIGSFAWVDVELDGDIDFVALQNEGLFLYRNDQGHFSQESLTKSASEVIEDIGETTDNKWLYDGKLTVADYDRDGDLDILLASKRGNVLLVNERGRLVAVEPTNLGLPAESSAANWVDFDNDGWPDVHFVPQGLFRQFSDQRFERTGELVLHPGQYDAAIVNFFDMDNDGRQDVLMALHEAPEARPWWQFSKDQRSPATWDIKGFRNIGDAGHWLQVKLIGGMGNRQGIGAHVSVVLPDGEHMQVVGSTDGSFFSQGHYRLYFGLGRHSKAEAVRVRWPDGSVTELSEVAADRLLVVDRGQGT